jgi:hypothetical protein
LARFFSATLLLCALVSQAVAADAPAAGPAPAAGATPAGFVHADGLVIKDENNKELRLKGVNLGGWLLWEGWIWGGGYDAETPIARRLEEVLGAQGARDFRNQVYSQFVTEKDIARIAAMGFNTVRVPINHRLLDDAGPGAGKDAGWQVLDRLLDWCEKHRVYVVLDLASAPGGQSKYFCADPDGGGRLWDSEDNQARTALWWKAVAARYKDRRIIAGYDLLDEPIPPDGAKLVALYKRIIAAVREGDRGHLVFLQGADFSRDLGVFSGPLDPNQAYTFHMYTWLTFFSDDRGKLLEHFRTVARAHRVPLWNGEFGENTPEMLESTVALLENPANLVTGYCFWTWKKVPNKYPALVSFDPPEGWKTLMSWVSGSWFTRKPSPEAAAEAVRGFFASVEADRGAEDTRLREILHLSK